MVTTATSYPAHQLKTSFSTQQVAAVYIYGLPSQMASMGYLSASVDSVWYGKDTAVVRLYMGRKFSFHFVQPNDSARKLLTALGIPWKKNQSLESIQKANTYLLDHFENTGYPFAAIELDSAEWINDSLRGTLKINPGPLYKIDSISTVYGKIKLKRTFLQRYLHIANGSLYNKYTLDQIDQRISELPFLQQARPWQMDMLADGGVVRLFLEPKRSSQIYALLGFAPASQQLGGNKLLLTGEANINLKNALGAGESIGINWQQLQYKSPRLYLQLQYPYIFQSAFGVDGGFELFKKDSQWININARIGILYEFSARKMGKIFLQTTQTNALTIDTNAVKNTKQLPAVIDVGSMSAGFEYQYNATNYRFNPRKGWDIVLQASAGIKNIKRNNDILKLKDATNPSFSFASLYDSIQNNNYQLRIKTAIQYYQPLGKQTVLKAALQGGWYQSPNIFRNEMFQIGGYRLLRGFDEESIYTNLYGVLTAEFRYLIGVNSYFFCFADGGYAGYTQRQLKDAHTYLGTGFGLAFETGSSILNISLAVGKRSDVPFTLRQPKIHVGFVNLF